LKTDGRLTNRVNSGPRAYLGQQPQ